MRRVRARPWPPHLGERLAVPCVRRLLACAWIWPASEVAGERFGRRDRDLRAARAGLRPNGVLVMNLFGGNRAEKALVERTRKRAQNGPDGTMLPAFTYVWEHESFNAVDRRLLAHIHFDLTDQLFQKDPHLRVSIPGQLKCVLAHLNQQQYDHQIHL